MPFERKTPLYKLNAAGIYVPSGFTAEEWRQKKARLEDMDQLADSMENVFRSRGITIRNGSSLGDLLSNARVLSKMWKSRDPDRFDECKTRQAVQFFRISESVLKLGNTRDNKVYLKRLLKDSLDFHDRKWSRAKDTLWEIELWSTFREKLESARLCDPPDIVLDFDGRRFGIACKKLYSPKRLQSTISQAAEQVEGKFDVGIIAINLDELVSPDGPAVVADQQEMRGMISQFLKTFLKEQDSLFRKYLEGTRVTGAIVSATAIINMPKQQMEWGFVTKSDIWTIRGVESTAPEQVRKLYELVLN